MDIRPIEIEGRQIARTFWGKAWCRHLEKFSDYANRLPRGRTYVRNGSVCHLDIGAGVITAMVMGSRMYNVKVEIKALPKKKWLGVKKRCAKGIGSLLELLEGRLSKSVMEVVTDRDTGLFPLPREIGLSCDCPDWAVMCKHVASVLYGVGARLDEEPELLFKLRRVKHEELISREMDVKTATRKKKDKRKRIAKRDLSEVFGIEIADETDDGPDRVKKTAGRIRRKKKTTKPVQRSVKPAKKMRARGRPAKKQTNADTKSRRIGKRRRPAASEKRADRTETGASSGTGKKRSIRGKDVISLRDKFDMSKSEFSRLLGVSITTIVNWGKKRGPIKFQARTLDAWNVVAKLSRKKAWQRLERL